MSIYKASADTSAIFRWACVNYAFQLLVYKVVKVFVYKYTSAGEVTTRGRLLASLSFTFIYILRMHIIFANKNCLNFSVSKSALIIQRVAQ